MLLGGVSEFFQECFVVLRKPSCGIDDTSSFDWWISVQRKVLESSSIWGSGEAALYFSSFAKCLLTAYDPGAAAVAHWLGRTLKAEWTLP